MSDPDRRQWCVYLDDMVDFAEGCSPTLKDSIRRVSWRAKSPTMPHCAIWN